MLKFIGGLVVGIALLGVVMFFKAGSFMFNEIESPYSVEETAARIQRNIQRLEDRGWKLSGLRDPSKAVAASGTNVLPVLLVEACSTKYSGPLLKEDETRALSILMPCTITVFISIQDKVDIGAYFTF